MMLLQMPSNGVRSGVQALLGQLLAEPRTINSTVAAGIAVGELFGRRDRGSNAASPSDRYRATRRLTQPCETP
jgi:hypothetical protein